jgi:hypothetical protein
MKQVLVGLCLMIMTIPIVAGPETDFLLNSVDIDRYMGAGGAKKGSEEKKLEDIQSYMLETLFLKPFTENNDDVLSEEEKEEYGAFSDKTMQTSLMNRMFSRQLSRQDLLGFKKIYMKPKLQPIDRGSDVPNSVLAAPYTIGKLTD